MLRKRRSAEDEKNSGSNYSESTGSYAKGGGGEQNPNPTAWMLFNPLQKQSFADKTVETENRLVLVRSQGRRECVHPEQGKAPVAKLLFLAMCVSFRGLRQVSLCSPE